MPINPRIFRAYDIRGKANIDLTVDASRLIGRGFGSVLREMYKSDHPTVVVGWDARSHSPSLATAAIEGLISAGCKVLVMGQTPSPVNYFTICRLGLDAGLQVTASHNPKEDNGIKLQLRDAEAYSGDDLQDLRVRIEKGRFVDGQGTQETIDAVTPYIETLATMFPNAGKGMRVVVDTGNGVAGPVYAEALHRVGCDVTGLYLEPHGEFPNHQADPSQHQTLVDLQKLVREKEAHLGLAFDGDGDRLGIVDEKGVIRTPDEILLLLAEDLLTRHPGSSVIFTVSNSGILDTEIAAAGGKPVMCKVGHSFVEHAMRDNHALLGGEQSGHFFCAEDYHSFDDAMVAALRFLSIAHAKNAPLSSVLDRFPKVFQAPERRPFCPDDRKTAIVKSVTEHFAKTHHVNTMDGARIDFGNGAWAGIRQSNTSPCLSICIEARSEQDLQAVEREILDHIRTYPEVRLEA